MNLSCYFVEKFQSRIGKELEYRDELHLWKTRGSDTWDILSVSNQGNQAVFDKYCEWLKTQPGADEIMEEYSYEDNGRIVGGAPKENFTPVRTYTRYEYDLEWYQKFFKKYGGIDNVEFCAD